MKIGSVHSILKQPEILGILINWKLYKHFLSPSNSYLHKVNEKKSSAGYQLIRRVLSIDKY